MIHDLEQFGIRLYSMEDDFCKKPPLTYETYNAILRQHLMKFRKKIIAIEKSLMKQGKSFFIFNRFINIFVIFTILYLYWILDGNLTFLSLSSILKKNLYSIQILHEVHKRSVLNWKLHPNWKCASKLLSSLYFEIQNSHNIERTNICTSLYLSSLTVYLNIIDTWLSDGRFEDWREEFIIAR